MFQVKIIDLIDLFQLLLFNGLYQSRAILQIFDQPVSLQAQDTLAYPH